jgi:uncharacterized protein YukE
MSARKLKKKMSSATSMKGKLSSVPAIAEPIEVATHKVSSSWTRKAVYSFYCRFVET